MIRHRRFSIAAFVVLSILSVSLVSAQHGLSGPQIRQLEAYIEKARRDWNVPGCAITIVKNDTIVFEKGYGIRELGKPAPVDEHTVFAIASCSKAFTAAAVGILVDEGKLKWDGRVAEYLPDFQMYDPWVTREMQVRDLLSHRSGLATFGADLVWYWTTYDQKEVLRRVRYLKPRTSLRTEYGYQNVMFLAAGEVVAAVSGKSWNEFVKERIFLPLGMTTTITSVRDIKPGDNIATPHNEYEGKLRVIQHFDNDNMAPAGGIITSVHEMAQWIRLQLGRGMYQGKKIFSESACRTMWSPHMYQTISPRAEQREPTTHFRAYGLGWGMYDYHGRKVLSHGGGIDGMTSRIMLVPEENLGVMVVTNSESPLSGTLAQKAVDLFLGLPDRDLSAEALRMREEAEKTSKTREKAIEDARVKGTKPSLAMESYAGTYLSDLYGELRVSLENGKLVITFVPTKDLVADLDHWHFGTFRVSVRPMNYPFGKGFATFKLDARGAVEQLEVDIPNPDFDFKELELKKVK